jgi:hypothetical protein
MNPIHLRARTRTRRLQIFAVLATLIASMAIATTASASTTQSAVILDPSAQTTDPAATLSQFREVGATTVRVLLKWYTVAPKANSRTAPKGFAASSPAAYSSKLFAQYDTLISDAVAQGMKVDLDIMGGPPTWAQGKGAPTKFIQHHYGWEPDATEFGQFVTAVAKRYNGHFKVGGQTLPKVSIFSLWNEPNFGQQVGPQQIRPTKKSANVLVSPLYYRNLLRSGYASLKKNAKGATILFGETAAHGKLGPTSGLDDSQVSISAPLPWLQTLYCLNSRYKHLTGAAGKAAGCTNLGSFKKQNPALFSASAYAAHPYASQFAPNVQASKIPSGDFILPVISRLTTALDKANKAWRSSKKFPVWSTEYGFVTNPPFKPKKGQHYPSPATAATYLNEAEYLSYKNPRVATYAQYLINDPPTIAGVGLFASGLRTSTGALKPGFNAYRLPLWMPKQSVSSSASTEIWGGARPAVFGFAQDKTPQSVQIQKQSSASAPWTTLATEIVSNVNGYFDTHLKLASGGNLRLAYTYPADVPFLPIGIAGSTVFSRTVKVTVH